MSTILLCGGTEVIFVPAGTARGLLPPSDFLVSFSQKINIKQKL
jgi:hypothetical protein